MIYSKYLTPRAYQGLMRLGDVLLPGTAQMPRFSDTDCINHVDEILIATAAKDRADLLFILRVFSVLPIGWLRGILHYASKVSSAPIFPACVMKAPIGVLARGRDGWKAQWRLLDLGLRGVVFSLYYSGLNNGLSQTPNVHQQMGYQLVCQPLDADKP
ncbi:hypothetical protein [uncultured Shewanella sp.]|uniref:hypothetical protein n=1 Tax=uncultured Shewanella sp. TaxID=173975 RepID=UPI002623A337|nr:hypothetical protein [uncultured Shewanella sp.]